MFFNNPSEQTEKKKNFCLSTLYFILAVLSCQSANLNMIAYTLISVSLTIELVICLDLSINPSHDWGFLETGSLPV